MPATNKNQGLLMNRLTRPMLVSTLVALASCGGGGGGDDQGPPPPGGNNFRVQADRANVTFDFVQGEIPTSQVINATWSGTPPAQLYVSATLEGVGLLQVIPLAVSGTSATITLNADRSLSGGTYTGRVMLLVCSDPACTERIGGTPIPVNYTISVRTPAFTGPQNIEFRYTRGTTPVQTPVTLNVVAGAGDWTATASSPFITLSRTSGNGAGPISVFFNPAGLSSSLHLGTVTVSGAGGSQAARVSLNLATPLITASIAGSPSSSFSFSGINGAPLAPIVANVSLLDVTGSLPMSVSSNQPWLGVSAATINAPGIFTITLNPAIGSLASGTHAASVRIEVGNGNFNVVRDIPVALTLTRATLSLPDAIVLGGRAGRYFEQIPAQISLNTGTNSHPWSFSGVPVWASADRVSGNSGATGQQILFQPLRLQSTPGTATTTLNFTAQVNGDTLTRNIPLSFTLDTHRLLASENGVSLVTTADASWRRLSRTVRIRDNMGFTTPWTASDDAAWLTTTPSGNSDGDLVMQANATGLADGLHLATISITSGDTTVAGPERIRVGLWVSSSAPPATQGDITGVLDIFNSIVSDPIRPYVYTHQRNGPTGSVRIFNVYTGAEELPAITGVPTGTIDLDVGVDGSTLLAYDRDAGIVARVNLDTRALEGTFAAPRENFSDTSDQVALVRPNGVGVVLTNGGVAYLAATGQRLGFGFHTYFDVTDDQEWVFAGSIRRSIDYTSAGGGTFLSDDSVSVDVNLGFSRDTGTRADGSRVYVGGASVGGPPYGFRRYDGVTMTALAPLPNGGAFANNVEVGSDGRVYTSSTNRDANDHNIWMYGPDDAHTGSFLVAQGIDDRGLVVSGDGMIVIVNRGGGNPGLVRIPIGPE
jgi:hypothetical protein